LAYWHAHQKVRGVETEAYYLQQAADMERFARAAYTVAEHDAFLMVAENCRTLARDAAQRATASEAA